MKQYLKLCIDNKHQAAKPITINKIANADSKVEATLYIYGIIDEYYVNAQAVAEAITSAQGADTLHVYINSPGGDVFEGRAIMAALRRFDGKTVAHIDSLCASAATSIALACDTVEMSEGAMFMIHNASGFAWGDKTELRETADLLEKIELAIVNDYTTKTGKPAEEIVALMDAETWFTAQEALDGGFVDSIATGKQSTTNAWNLAAYKNAPKAETPAPENKDKPAEAIAVEIERVSATQSNQNKLALAMIL